MARLRTFCALRPEAQAPLATGLPPAEERLLDYLQSTGLLPCPAIDRIRAARLHHGVPTIDSLLAEGPLDEAGLLDATSAALAAPVRRDGLTADSALVERLGIDLCLSMNLLPLGPAGGAVILATSRPAEALRQADRLRTKLGAFRLVLAERTEVEAALLKACSRRMAERAETRIPVEESCRVWQRRRPGWPALAALALVLLPILLFPLWTLAALTLWAVFTLVATTGFKIVAIWTTLQHTRRTLPRFRSHRRGPPVRSRIGDAGQSPALPMISILVPLFREPEIAGRLIRRLGALSYPKERLEICLVTEANDSVTRAAIARAELPWWMRVVEVPAGQLKTKPRALNYALGLCRGEVIGIYDAEDAPEPDQLQRVAAGFANAPPDVVCLQGSLDYYNAHQNWLSRLFTIEYATWFRLVLPGLARLGLVVPLGGTTLFFRRAALETIGGWDAWNVTEDADLGLRLARHGWRTRLVRTVTGEEANCRVWPWVRQRSRWLKGYAMTWATHMRNPLALWRELGPRQFWGVQLLFLGTLSQYLLAPLLWSFWALPMGLGHPLVPLFGWPVILGFGLTFFIAEAVNLASALIALRMTHHRGLAIWVPAIHLYFPLGTIAAWRALAQALTRPFYWEKTTHGLARPTAAQEVSIRRASERSLVS
ncbi:glycosyltransferase family 2 protein [Frigidibacter sp. ROC022]|uniref:glycosyltransferase family 2 protein n=1 Tax=Frigidibacter sp. ROC022 TaxID=2971796 RepID=UPI00215A9096|nr:glycosyltransferase [Frigidibacter sp. ROC022]MCR8725265.1 glycosyltransferase [Frigidibacter sp. ROC022]